MGNPLVTVMALESGQVVTIILAIVAAVGASTVTGLFSRPTTKATAGATEATGEVAYSADAREWATKFEQRADRAEQRAQAAEERADEAERSAADTARRCAELEERFDVAVRYIRGLRDDLVAAGRSPAPVPPVLIPPLSRHD